MPFLSPLKRAAAVIMADLEYTVKQAARELGVSARTVRRWLASGRLSGRRDVRGNLGLEWRIDADSVRRVAADVLRGHNPTDMANGHPTDMAVETLEALASEVRSLREENAAYREHLERLTLEVMALRETVQRLLPPAPEERRRPWWRRLWRREE